MRVSSLFSFIRERHSIYVRRFELGHSKPWTRDPILRAYRFCNVYRELDKVTQWITERWRQPHSADVDLWFAMTVARFLNWPPTLTDIGYPVPFQYDKVKRALERRLIHDEQIFTGAYLVKSHKGRKIDYVLDSLFKPLWHYRKQLRPHIGDTLTAYNTRLLSQYGFGTFMAGQVIADLKHTEPLIHAKDWATWATSGPGSRRGLYRVLHGDTVRNVSWNEAEWFSKLQKLHKKIIPLVEREEMPFLDAQDLQNCLCEFDKYERVRLGQGRPRSRYNGGAE